MASISRRKLGDDVINMVSDIHRHEKTGRKRDTTWGIGKDKLAKRRIENTMGYVGSTGTGTQR